MCRRMRWRRAEHGGGFASRLGSLCAERIGNVLVLLLVLLRLLLLAVLRTLPLRLRL